MDEGTEEQPGAGLVTHAVANTADEGTTEESGDGSKGLFVTQVEGEITVARWAFKKPCNRNGKLLER